MDLIAALLDRRSSGAPKPPEAAALGRRMTALYRCWQRNERDLEAVAQVLIDWTGIAPDDPLARTARQAATAVARWGGHPYHSAGHHAEVATNAMVLAALSGRMGRQVPPHDRGVLLCAALTHDVYFDAGVGAMRRFAAEERSAAALDDIAAWCAVAADDRQAMRLLVLATEPLSRDGLRALLNSGTPHPVAALRPLGAQPETLLLAALLSDADLLSSSGLTNAWQVVQRRRLEMEWGRRIGVADQLAYFDDIVGPDFISAAGRYFSGNLAHIRADALREAAVQAMSRPRRR